MLLDVDRIGSRLDFLLIAIPAILLISYFFKLNSLSLGVVAAVVTVVVVVSLTT